MADENLLRYNGMLIGVFELLADNREQISSVIAAINAQQQFWLADAALERVDDRQTGLDGRHGRTRSRRWRIEAPVIELHVLIFRTESS